MIKNILFIFIVLSTNVFCAASADDLLRGPWDTGSGTNKSADTPRHGGFGRQACPESAEHLSFGRQAGVELMFFYQKFVSPQIDSDCQFYPSCSEYCKQAIYNYGFFKGWMMGIERLTRCNRWAKSYKYPLIKKKGRMYLWDLPENNLLNQTN